MRVCLEKRATAFVKSQKRGETIINDKQTRSTGNGQSEVTITQNCNHTCAICQDRQCQHASNVVWITLNCNQRSHTHCFEYKCLYHTQYITTQLEETHYSTGVSHRSQSQEGHHSNEYKNTDGRSQTTNHSANRIKEWTLCRWLWSSSGCVWHRSDCCEGQFRVSGWLFDSNCRIAALHMNNVSCVQYCAKVSSHAWCLSRPVLKNRENIWLLGSVTQDFCTVYLLHVLRPIYFIQFKYNNLSIKCV